MTDDDDDDSDGAKEHKYNIEWTMTPQQYYYFDISLLYIPNIEAK